MMLRLILSAALCAAAPATILAQAATTRAASVDADRVSAAVELTKSGDHAKAIELTNDIEKSLRLAKAKPGDPAMIYCLHVRGVAQYRMGQFKAAADTLQRTALFAGANREITLNLAVSDMRDATMLPRSIKNLQAFATKNPSDEQAVNLWGAAVAKLNDAKKVNDAKTKEFETAYAAVNAQLERTRPGSYHWGSEWIDKDEHARIEKLREKGQKAIDSAEKKVRSAEDYLRDSQADLAAAKAPSVGGGSVRTVQDRQADREQRIAYAEAAVKKATARLESAKAALEKAEDGVPQPTWVGSDQMVDPTPLQ